MVCRCLFEIYANLKGQGETRILRYEKEFTKNGMFNDQIALV